MSLRMRLGMGVVMAVAAVALCIPAQAYIFWGIFDGYPSPRPFKWALSYMDTNGDGDVNGPNEGIEITFESGPFGWTDAEMAVLEEAFDVWERVPGSYAAFRFAPPITGPLEIDDAGVDFINYITIQDPEAPPSAFEAPLPPLVLGITLMTMAVTDLDVPFDDDVIFVPGATIVECDILFEGSFFRVPPGQEPVDLLSVAVHEVGHLLSIGHPALNNLRDGDGEIVESPAVSWRDHRGELVQIGVTPTMFPVIFSTRDQAGNLVGGGGDLAPDDIAAIVSLYPRQGALGEFFTINGVARTQSREAFPSMPIAGGHVVAWADADNNPATPRIPLISTLTGLYEAPFDPQWRGRFQLRGLPKVLETLGSPDAFAATYAVSLNELNGSGYENQTPPIGNIVLPIIDATHIFNPLDARQTYETLYPQEVFHEDGEIFNLTNVDAGTPMVWDPARNTVVSANTGETLAEMTADGPMFGDPDSCPVGTLFLGLKSQNGPNLLRGVRDYVLLKTGAGASFVAWYYDAGPVMTRFLLDHTLVYWPARAMAIGTEWVLAHILEVVLMLVLGMIAWRMRRIRTVAAVTAAAALMVLWTDPSHALIQFAEESEVIEIADAVVVGTVTSVESREVGERHRIVTDVVITVQDSLKGTLNKTHQVFIRQSGGRVGGLVTYGSELPLFIEGEDVLLYLKYQDNFGYAVIGGARGMYQAKMDAKSNEYVVTAPQAEQEIAKKAAAAGAPKALKEANPSDGQVGVRVLKAYIDQVLKEAQS